MSGVFQVFVLRPKLASILHSSLFILQSLVHVLLVAGIFDRDGVAADGVGVCAGVYE